jgi:hypothetical protein
MALGDYGRARRYAQEALFWAERLRMQRELRDARSVLEQLEKRMDSIGF